MVCEDTGTYHHYVDGQCEYCGYVMWSSRCYVPWTFRRVYRVWGLGAAIQFLFRKDIEAVDGDEVLDRLDERS